MLWCLGTGATLALPQELVRPCYDHVIVALASVSLSCIDNKA